MPHEPEPTFACACAQWKGWVLISEPSFDTGTLTVRPCASCRAEAFQRWADRKWNRTR